MKSNQIVTLLTAFTLAGLFCLKPPALPQWDTTLNVPLYQTTLRLVDFLDTARFKVGLDSTLSFAADFPIDTITPSGVIDLVNENETDRISIADFILTGLTAGRAGIDIEELIGMSVPDSGAKQAIPAFERTFERPCEIPGVAWAEVMRAKVRVTVSNHTGLALDSVALVMPFGRQVLGPLAPAAAQSAEFEIAGAYLESPVKVVATAGSPGTAGDTIKLSKTDSVAVELEIDSVQVTNARVKMPDARGERWCHVVTQSSKPFKIDSLTLATGTCHVELTNDFGLPVSALVRIPKLGKECRLRLAGHSSTGFDLDLAGVKVDNRAKTNSLFDCEVIAVPDRSNDYVDLTKTDGVTVSYEIHSLRPARVAGTFTSAVYVAAKLDTLPRFLPAGVHGIRVPNADVVLDLENSIGFPLNVSLELQAIRDGAVLKTVEQSLTVLAGELGAPVAGEWVLPITDLINAGPDLITLNYSVLMTGTGSYDNSAWLAGRAVMGTPFRFALVPDTVPVPARKVVLAQSHRDAIARHFVSGKAVVTVGNQFPVGFSGWLLLAADSSAPPDPDAVIDQVALPFTVARGRLDRSDNCVGETDTVAEFDIDSLTATLFRRSPLSVRLFLVLPASDTMNFRATDKLHLSALLEANVRVEP